MKRLIWVLAIMIESSTYAQEVTKTKKETTEVKHKLRSPEFKNYKPWEHKNVAKNILVQTTSSKKTLRSPEYKNSKPWEHRDDSKTVAIQTTSNKKNLRSPEYKNYKPWRD